MAIAPDYGQQFLLPPALEDWVGADHPVRFIREFVDQLDLRELGFVVPDGSEGRPPYATSLLLKIWLFGYLHRIRSTRRLEAACREHMALLWLSGMIAPDHNSLWRFWRDNKQGIGALFKHSVRLAAKEDLVGLVLQAVDGTKIQATASGRTGWSKEHLEKLLEVLEAELAQADREIAAAGPVEAGSQYQLPEALRDKQALREAVKAGLKEMQQQGREHYHPQEPQARRMQCDGKNRFGYNAQAVVDQKSGVVVAADVSAQENDVGHLVPMIEQAKQNVPPSGAEGPVTVADTGYGTGGDIGLAADKKINVLVYPQEGSPAKGSAYHASRFIYEPQADTVRCPRGERLVYERSRFKAGQSVKVYRCHCPDCPVRKQCTRDKRSREFTVRPYTVFVQAMRERLTQPGMRELLRQRGRIVERFFAQVKQTDGFRRWTVRTLEGVRTQWALLCCIHNLRVLYANWRKAAA